MTNEQILEMGFEFDGDAPATYCVREGSYTPVSVGADRARAFRTKGELLIFIQKTAFISGERKGGYSKQLEVKRVLGL